MKYISTRGGLREASFSDTVMMGLARDGGLVLPESIPDFTDKLDELSRLNYHELAFKIMQAYVDLDLAVLRKILKKSYDAFDIPEVVECRKTGDVYILELFHGPTLAFKDVALQFLGNVFEHILEERGEGLNIVAATSGDTGSAAIHGVRGRKGMRIFVMHPKGRVSRIQALQMTSVMDENVINIAVEGTFDDCQAILKELLNDLGFKDKYHLGSVNSINWARLLAQVVYYFYSCFRVTEKEHCREVSFAVPTGNFGDVFAGYIAYKMGLPIRNLYLCTNDNDILSRFFNTGEYKMGGVVASLSPSMDIQVASNFERFLYYETGANPAKTKELMATFARDGVIKPYGDYALPKDCVIKAGKAGERETLETISLYWSRYEYLLDPHTAVGVCTSTRLHDASCPLICLATAHPAKFPEAIMQAVGLDIARHPRIEALKGLPSKVVEAPATADAIRRRIESVAG